MTAEERRAMPEFVIRITHDDNGDVWEVLQRCIDVDYYVTLRGFQTLEEAEAAIADTERVLLLMTDDD